MSDLSDIRDGIKAALESAIPRFRVYAYPPNNADQNAARPFLQYPCAVIEAEEADGQYLTIGSNTFEVEHTLTVYVKTGSPAEGWKELDEYRSPSGAKSIRAAIRADAQLNSQADDADVEWASSGEVGRNNPEWTWEYSCQIGIRVIKSVA